MAAMTVDKSLAREVRAMCGPTRDTQRAFRQRVGAAVEMLSSPEVMERFDAAVAVCGRAVVAVAVAATLRTREERIGRWQAAWADGVLEAWRGLPEVADYAIRDGLHPLRIMEYAAGFIRANSERAD